MTTTTETWWCDRLRVAVCSSRIGFMYKPISRSYGFTIYEQHETSPLVEIDETNWRNMISFYKIKYCPWCGSELPYSLSLNWHEEIEKAGFELNRNEDDEPPDHLASSKWWREGLGNTAFNERPFEPISDADCRDSEGELGVGDRCPYLFGTTSEKSSSLTYQGKWRDYGVRTFFGSEPLWSQPLRYVRLDYSPWCGRRYPYSLKDYWFGMIRRLKLDPDSRSLPDRLMTDYWWRARPDLFHDDDAGKRGPGPNPCTPPTAQLRPA